VINHAEDFYSPNNYAFLDKKTRKMLLIFGIYIDTGEEIFK
jgi:hypothetical protein